MSYMPKRCGIGFGAAGGLGGPRFLRPSPLPRTRLRASVPHGGSSQAIAGYRKLSQVAAGSKNRRIRASKEPSEGRKNRIALAPAIAQYRPMLARVLSAALSRQSAGSATEDVNGIEALPVEAEVKGQESVKRALEIAAASGNNVLMLYPINRQAKLHFSLPEGPSVSTSLKREQ